MNALQSAMLDSARKSVYLNPSLWKLEAGGIPLANAIIEGAISVIGITADETTLNKMKTRADELIAEAVARSHGKK